MERHQKFYGHGKLPRKPKTNRKVVKQLGRPEGLGKTYAHRRTALAAGRLALSRNPGAEVVVIDRPDGLFDMVVTI